MKSRNWLPVAVVPVVMLCAFTFAYRASFLSGGHSDDERTIRQLNEECLHAHDVADVATLERIEDADFTISGDFGVVNQQQHLDKVRQRTTKTTEVVSRKIDPQVFRFYDNVALVTETDRPTTKDGTFAYQSTEVWVRRGTTWKLVHLHYSRLDEKE